MAKEQNFDSIKTFKTMQTMLKALSKYEDFGDDHYVPMVVPYGKNEGRYTAIFPARGGDGHHWSFRGFIVM